VRDHGMGFIPLIAAAIPAIASMIPSLLGKKGPSAAEKAAVLQAQEDAKFRRNLIMVGALGVVAVGVVLYNRRRRKNPKRRSSWMKGWL